MPDWRISKICANSSTPKESLRSTRRISSRNASPAALQKAARSSVWLGLAAGMRAIWFMRRSVVANGRCRNGYIKIL